MNYHNELNKYFKNNINSLFNDINLYDVKKDMIDLINHILPQKNKLEVIKEAPSWYHPGRSGTLMLNKSIKVGFFGELHPKISSFHKIKNRIKITIDLNNILIIAYILEESSISKKGIHFTNM